MSVRTLPVTRAYASPDSRSARLYQAALRVMPGGSTRLTIYSPPYPPYAAFGEACWLTDVDTDYRSAAWTAEEAGVLVGQNGLGCLSTPMAEAEVDLLVDSVAAAMAEAA